MMTSIKGRMAWAVLGSLALAGCAAGGEEPTSSNFASVTAIQGCALGGVGGAALGLLVGGDALGAIIGGAGGALIGCSAGATLDARRAQYASEAEFLDGQLEIAEASNQELLALQAGLDLRIAQNRQTIEALEQRALEAESERVLVAKDVERALADYNRAAEKLRLARLELQVQERALDAYVNDEDQAAGADQVQELTREVAEMHVRLDALEQRMVTLAGLNETLSDLA